jgi:hypothetical protein
MAWNEYKAAVTKHCKDLASRSYGRNLYIKNESLSDIEWRRDRIQLSVQNESKVMNAFGREKTMAVTDTGHKREKKRHKFNDAP